jgi:hypothetical protein
MIIEFTPIIVALMGVVIHFLGIFKILIIAPLKVDLAILIIDLLVAYGLYSRRKWGWNLAILLFIQQSIMQPYWAIKNYQNSFFVVYPIEGFIASILVVLSLFILIAYRHSYK